MGIRKIGLDANGFGELLDGPVEVLPLLENHADVVVGLGKIGVEPDRITEFGQAVIRLSRAQEFDALLELLEGLLLVHPQHVVMPPVSDVDTPGDNEEQNEDKNDDALGGQEARPLAHVAALPA